MRCSILRSLLFTHARHLLKAAHPLALAVLAASAASAPPARAQAPAAQTAPTTTTVFLGDVTTSAPASLLNTDEARRLFFKTTAPTVQPREVTLPPSTERKRLSQLRETLVPTQISQAPVLIRALEGFFDFDPDDQIIYSPGRTRIRYGTYFLEADRVIYDNRLQEAQAEGNVVVMIGQDKLSADSLRYNFKNDEGVAFNVSGSHAPIYFRPANPKKTDTAGAPGIVREAPRGQMPQFQKVSRQESIFRETNVTTCDFKVPHYHVRGHEIVLFQNDRIFMRGATFYVWDVPVLYLPAYTRSLTEASPWFSHFGYSRHRAGAFARLGYSYQHQTEEPSFENEEEYKTRSFGKADVYIDYLSNIGPGAGFDYRYRFEYDKHRGELQVYNIYDHGRDVVGASPGLTPHDDRNGKIISYSITDPGDVTETDRWRFMWRHRTDITDNLNLTVNIDQFSDPDVFYDILDLYTDRLSERERQIVRGSSLTLTNIEETFVTRLMFDIRDRIGVNRIANPSNPIDNVRDFDLDPYVPLAQSDANGISARRWGRVSERLPQFDLASRYLPIGNRSLYYYAELNAYNNLDKGLNYVNTNDDHYVQGAQFYNQIMHQWKLSPYYTMIAKAGFGAGTARRDGEGLGISDFKDQVPIINSSTREPLFVIDGTESALFFVDNNGTFEIGRRKRNFNQIKDNYIWGDTSVQFNARFSDAFSGNLGWRYRQTTRDYIGDFYASLGSQTFREDLFNYPIREHLLDAGLNYRLAQPLLTLFTRAALNLEPHSKLYSKEDTMQWTNGFNWSNQRQTLVVGGYGGVTRQQLYDPTDPNQYEENRLVAGTTLSYSPIHQRWYTMVRLRYDQPLNNQIKTVDEFRNLTFFTERQTDTNIQWVYGRELGPKYNTEFRIRWDEQTGGLRDVAWLLQRDLHDAVAILRIQVRQKDTNINNIETSANQFDVRVGLKFKLPNKDVTYTNSDVRTLRDRVRQPEEAY